MNSQFFALYFLNIMKFVDKILLIKLRYLVLFFMLYKTFTDKFPQRNCLQNTDSFKNKFFQ